MNENNNIMERVKTFEDAINVLGKDHPLVKEYQGSYSAGLVTLAFRKLRIITAALNEGWEPKFTKDENRYYPYFYFYRKDEYDAMDEDERANLILLNEPNNDVYAGFAFATPYYVPSDANARIDSRLCFKTAELAKYAGKQFIKLYYDFYYK